MAVKPRPDYWGERLALSHESSPNPAQSDLRRGLRFGVAIASKGDRNRNCARRYALDPLGPQTPVYADFPRRLPN